jgi:GNAT superfamily N-acetyltransferase
MAQLLGTIQTHAGELAITRAGLDDIPAIIAIQAEAADWLLSRGIDMWHIDREQATAYLQAALTGYPPTREVYLAWRGAAHGGLARGSFATGEHEPVATFSLQASDSRIWGDMPDDALYLHGFAVRRAVGGKGVGLALLRWAEDVAAAAGKTYLRLDCMAENPALRVYYERAGFTHRGDMYGQTWGASLYERRVRATEDTSA